MPFEFCVRAFVHVYKTVYTACLFINGVYIIYVAVYLRYTVQDAHTHTNTH